MLGLLPGSQGTVLAPSVGSLRKKLPLSAISGDLHPVMDLARITEIPGCPRVASRELLCKRSLLSSKVPRNVLGA